MTTSLQFGMIGLGRMGASMAQRLLRAGHTGVGYDVQTEKIARLAADGARGAGSLAELVQKLAPPRLLWMMVPVAAVDDAVAELTPLLQAGDVLVDGGNSFYRDSIRRAGQLGEHGVHFIDVGTSGGIAGLERGFCLMIGGEAATVRRLEPLFAALAPGIDAAPRTPGRATNGSAEHGYLYCGASGAGHFVKMVHNGIEYGLMAAYAEGFNLLRHGGEAAGLQLDTGEIAELWRRGSVIGSWLLDLTAQALLHDPALARFHGRVGDSGEGRWAVQTAIEAAVPVPVLSAALYARFASRGQAEFADKLLSAMRAGFGGHQEADDERGER